MDQESLTVSIGHETYKHSPKLPSTRLSIELTLAK